MKFLTGFSLAAALLGVALIGGWCTSVAIAAMGGPDFGLPGKIAGAGSSLLIIGGSIYALLMAAQAKSKTEGKGV